MCLRVLKPPINVSYDFLFLQESLISDGCNPDFWSYKMSRYLGLSESRVHTQTHHSSKIIIQNNHLGVTPPQLSWFCGYRPARRSLGSGQCTISSRWPGASRLLRLGALRCGRPEFTNENGEVTKK